MDSHIDFEVFPNGYLDLKEYLESLTNSYQEKDTFVLYLSTVYELLGLDNNLAGCTYSNFHWEKDKDENMTDLYLQQNI